MAAQPVTTDMSEADRYFFDLNGWMRVPGVLSPGEVDVCNAAIDAHATGEVVRDGSWIYTLLNSLFCKRSSN